MSTVLRFQVLEFPKLARVSWDIVDSNGQIHYSFLAERLDLWTYNMIQQKRTLIIAGKNYKPQSWVWGQAENADRLFVLCKLEPV